MDDRAALLSGATGMNSEERHSAPPGVISILDRMQVAGGHTTGFDYLRITLSVAVLVWHTIWYSGNTALNDLILSSKMRFIATGILPLFFSLSGFLVTSSLVRTRLHHFITLRVIRLVPALAVEVTLSALVLGPVFTKLSIGQYIASNEFYSYFLNIVGWIHYTLPGVFESNPGGPYINAQLWTIPFELECYIVLICLAFLTIVRRRRLYLMLVVLICLAFTVWPNVVSDPRGRQLVLCFLTASSLFMYREYIPYSTIVGIISGLLLTVLLITPGSDFLVPFAAAYFIVWVGLMRFPAIPFGDLSYGVFLFHLPIEQTIMWLMPQLRSWWVLSMITLPIAVCVAGLSWTFIEAPILGRKRLILIAVDKVWSIVIDNFRSAEIERQIEAQSNRANN